MNRREFLLGLGAGLVLPQFFDKVFAYVENHEEPLLWAPKRATTVMYAVPDLADYDAAYQLNLGDLYAEPPTEVTVRQFCEMFGEGNPEIWWREELMDPDGAFDWNAEVGSETVMDFWIPKYSTASRARRYLDTLDLGPQLKGAQAVGAIEHQYGGMCSGLHAYQAIDAVSLSLLQNRLNELKTGIRIEVQNWGL